jgi:hypothetical protein
MGVNKVVKIVEEGKIVVVIDSRYDWLEWKKAWANWNRRTSMGTCFASR